MLIYFLNQLIAYSKKQEKIVSKDIQAAVDYILENIYENISLDSLAEISGLSLSRFKQKFCQQLGFTPREYINFQKVETSKTMLEKGKSVTDTAIELGFSTKLRSGLAANSQPTKSLKGLHNTGKSNIVKTTNFAIYCITLPDSECKRKLIYGRLTADEESPQSSYYFFTMRADHNDHAFFHFFFY